MCLTFCSRHHYHCHHPWLHCRRAERLSWQCRTRCDRAGVSWWLKSEDNVIEVLEIESRVSLNKVSPRVSSRNKLLIMVSRPGRQSLIAGRTSVRVSSDSRSGERIGPRLKQKRRRSQSTHWNWTGEGSGRTSEPVDGSRGSPGCCRVPAGRARRARLWRASVREKQAGAGL